MAKFPGRAGIGAVDAPGMINFSPDGTALTYLASPPGSLSRTLCKLDLASGDVSVVLQDSADESSYSLEEKLRRERLRLLHTGVSHYEWASESTNMLIPQGSRALVILSKLGDAPLTIIDADKAGLPKEGTIMDPKLSSDGKLCVFVLAQEVYACATDGSMVASPVQLTSGARGTALNNGSADFLAQEEMDRIEGFWISPDNRTLAFEQFDESHIPLFTIPHHVDQPHEAETHRYPFAGAANPKVKLGLVPIDVRGARPAAPIWIDLGADEDIYVARVNWKDKDSLLVQLQNRRQTENRLLLVRAATGAATTLLTEANAKYVNLHHNLVPLADGGFIWSSEESGFMHLAVHNADGSKRLQLTSGEWVVDGTSRSMVDERAGRFLGDKAGVVYFLGNKSDLREKHLYRVPLGGGAITQVTREAGMHTVKLSRDFKTFVDTYNGLGHPVCVRVCALRDGSLLRVIFESSHPDLLRLRPLLESPEMVSFPSTDGKVTLFAAVYKPPASIFGAGPFPTVVEVYGGPHLQNVTKSWGCTADLRAHYLRLSGYLVLKVDNRGSARRGHAFESALHRQMGGIELDDQAAGVRWAVSQGLAISGRVGMIGWSYGGYMSAMSLAKHPDVFRCGIAGAPVTSWDGYDTHYTERYMGLPQENVDGYRESSVMSHVDKMRGALLIVHGMIDENVHFRHSARLCTALARARKPYALLAFPDERHLPRSVADKTYMCERILDFIKCHV